MSQGMLEASRSFINLVEKHHQYPPKPMSSALRNPHLLWAVFTRYWLGGHPSLGTALPKTPQLSCLGPQCQLGMSPQVTVMA